MKVNCFYFSLLIFIINSLYSQTIPLKDTVLTNICEKHKKNLIYLFGLSNISLFEIQTNEQNMIIIKKYFPYNFNPSSLIKVSFELHENIYFSRKVIAYFIHVKEKDGLSVQSHVGQGVVEATIVPTRYFWSLTNNVLVFYLVEEEPTEKLLNFFALVL